ncbi:MAG: hypothetical protein GY820_01810 [Gammaproteobacteria bacterium]|nr:hypothetical protein [Gammaproteobacteria bacterium]
MNYVDKKHQKTWHCTGVGSSNATSPSSISAESKQKRTGYPTKNFLRDNERTIGVKGVLKFPNRLFSLPIPLS